ncbi:MAG: hypothetical protein HYS25_02705 [Ignavibacteriales bacterium]|nr:hypothetical protein [Ignavibacteriales bacterium]
MKFFRCILLAYVLLNVTVPCAVYSECCEERNILTSLSYITERDDCADNCTPFYNCCGLMASFVAEKNFQTSTPDMQDYCFITINSGTILNSSFDFWRPPKEITK